MPGLRGAVGAPPGLVTTVRVYEAAGLASSKGPAPGLGAHFARAGGRHSLPCHDGVHAKLAKLQRLFMAAARRQRQHDADEQTGDEFTHHHAPTLRGPAGRG